MPKRKKQPATYLETAENKPDKLDWKAFNFLENLFIFCPMKHRSVPPESGVQFGISKEPLDEALCILFKIDRGSKDPLFTSASQVKPDYLVLYKTSRTCLFTIIEMKGRTEGGLEHGIEQIIALRDRLKRELSEHFPLSLNAVFQGILLCPYNAQPPAKRIITESKKGFVILPLLYGSKAELFPYVSKPNAITERYSHQSLPHSEQWSFLERLIVHHALPYRVEDTEYHAEYKTSNQTGVYINYALSKTNEYAAFISSASQNKAVVDESGDEHLSKIKAALAAVGLKSKFECRKLNKKEDSEVKP